MQNYDDVPAYYVDLKCVLDQSLSIVNFETAPEYSEGDSLFWQFDEIAPWSEETIVFQVQLPDSATDDIQQMITTAFVDGYNNDLRLSSDDVSADTVTVSSVATGADLDLTQKIRTNQFDVVDGDTLWTARPAETYIYKYIIQNNGQDTATGVMLYDYLPDSVYIHPDDLVGDLYGDTLFFYLGDLAPGASIVDSFKVTVFDEINDPDILFINTMMVDAANEDSSTWTDNISTSTIRLWQETSGLKEGTLVLSSNILRMDGTGDSFVISFDLEQERGIDIDLIDMTGYRIDTLVSDSFAAGSHSIEWDGLLNSGQTLGSGVYVLTLRSDDNDVTSWKKFMVQR